MNVLITGGAGFLGRHFTKWLLDRGHGVIIVDDLSTGLELSKWPKNMVSSKGEPLLLEADLRKFLPRIKEEAFDLAIHLAAVVGGREAIEGKPVQGANTIELDSAFFRWAVKNKPKQVVYLSSAASYPIFFQNKIGGRTDHIRELQERDLNVTDPYERIGMPDYIYGWAKVNGEKIAHTMSEKYELKVHIARPFSGYGEDQSMNYPIPAICQRIVNKENPFIVWGSGEQSRDFIHVDDLINAIMRRVRIKGRPLFDVVNYGTGRATSFKELAEIGNKLHGNDDFEIKCLTDKPEGVFYRVADVSKMRSFYQPKITLEEGVERMLEYLQSE